MHPPAPGTPPARHRATIGGGLPTPYSLLRVPPSAALPSPPPPAAVSWIVSCLHSWLQGGETWRGGLDYTPVGPSNVLKSPHDEVHDTTNVNWLAGQSPGRGCACLGSVMGSVR